MKTVKGNTVIIKLECQVLVEVLEGPEDASIEDWTDFYFNDSSSCKSNIVDKIKDSFDKEGNPCGCHSLKITFTREANESDHLDVLNIINTIEG